MEINYREIDLDNRLVQIITGVRRSGKSTLAHRALVGVNYAYVNFDDERLGMMDVSHLNILLEALYREYGEFSHFQFWSFVFQERCEATEGGKTLISGCRRHLLGLF